MRVTITLVFLIAFAMGAFGPALDAPPTPERSHIAVTVEKLCGSENAAWVEISTGVVQCYTHRGAKTIQARTAP